MDSERLNKPKGGYIEGIRGVYAGYIIEMEQGEQLTIGSSGAEANLIIRNENVSGKHCTITYNGDAGSYMVTDFSKESTYLSYGTRLSYGNPTIVPVNTIIYIGDIENAFKVR